ncbi:hypothetical protein SCHPADRAFT_973999 [Schizopora paradoxa]|uniref:Uncharacterized protein n=1 Tax=Schizopora paradoxa TaxID=27342 RepID=A0A0H2RIZ7_9AGAM|nr:hypothetical protein SCHPADRAFT_973999 [Schizopora paradoxa]
MVFGVRSRIDDGWDGRYSTSPLATDEQDVFSSSIEASPQSATLQVARTGLLGRVGTKSRSIRGIRMLVKVHYFETSFSDLVIDHVKRGKILPFVSAPPPSSLLGSHNHTVFENEVLHVDSNSLPYSSSRAAVTVASLTYKPHQDPRESTSQVLARIARPRLSMSVLSIVDNSETLDDNLDSLATPSTIRTTLFLVGHWVRNITMLKSKASADACPGFVGIPIALIWVLYYSPTPRVDSGRADYAVNFGERSME